MLLCLFSRCAPCAPSYISYDDSSHSEWALDFLLGRSTTGVACLIPSYPRDPLQPAIKKKKSSSLAGSIVSKTGEQAIAPKQLLVTTPGIG